MAVDLSTCIGVGGRGCTRYYKIIMIGTSYRMFKKTASIYDSAAVAMNLRTVLLLLLWIL